MKEEKKDICGEVIDLFQDKKINKLNFELAVLNNGTPVIILQDWTKENKSRDLVTLHLKEAVQLKAVIENLLLDATLFNKEYVEELMDVGERIKND